jgi:hypothetical protein
LEANILPNESTLTFIPKARTRALAAGHALATHEMVVKLGFVL